MTIKKRVSVLFILLIGLIIFSEESPVNAENQLPEIGFTSDEQPSK